ncbi:MAG: glycosyltransferase family 2 protein [Clostridia bacterium]|nr:glycosyltransferase family 2 protein [Clostridia bacterium]
MQISVIIPAYNEANFINDTIQAVRNFPWVEQIIVVDDGSTDGTGELAKACGSQVIKHPRNKGKGAAINSAAPFLTGKIIIILDGDLGKSAKECYHLLPPIGEGRADATVAKFPPATIPGGFGLVKGLAAQGVYRLTGQRVLSVLSGQRAMKIQVFKSLLPFASGFGVEVGATVDMLRQGWRLQEIEINMVHNFSRRDLAGFLHRGKQFYDICRVLANKR